MNEILNESIKKIIDWLPKIIDFFKPFRPEITHFQINYKDKKAVIYYKLDLEDYLIKKRISKIIIPNLPSYQIVNFYDEGFSNLNHIIKMSKDQKSYIIKTKDLPTNRYFQVVLSGKIEEQALKNIVRIQPALNKNSTPSYDRYWLDVMIRDIDTLEKIYHSLEINEINLSVRVATERYFTTELPKSLTRSLRIINEFLSAGKGRDRNLLFKKWGPYRLASNVDKDEIIKYFEDLTNNINLVNFIKIDHPFYTGNIGDFETHRVIPSSFNVEAITDLSFRKPAASGYLEFHKKNFQDAVRSEIKENWGNNE